MKSPLSIVLEAAEQYVNEIEYRSHDDATIARGDQITTAIHTLRDPATLDVALARAQRDWLLRLHELIDQGIAAQAGAVIDKLAGAINLLDAILDSLNRCSGPLQPTRQPGAFTFIYIVPRNTPSGLSLCAFEDEHRAHQYADRYPGALVYPETVMNDSAAGQFLIDGAIEEPAHEPEGEPGQAPNADHDDAERG